MTKEEAVACANGWVREHFAVVPPVAQAMLFNEALRHRLDLQVGQDLQPEVWDRLQDKWQVSYFCSWDTDALGLPETLHILVDDATGATERWDG